MEETVRRDVIWNITSKEDWIYIVNEFKLWNYFSSISTSRLIGFYDSIVNSEVYPNSKFCLRITFGGNDVYDVGYSREMYYEYYNIDIKVYSRGVNIFDNNGSYRVNLI